MTTPQPEHITILPPQKTKHRHTRKWKATVAALAILLLMATGIGGTLLHQHNKANSFPSLHAQGKDPVLQLQALYNEYPDQAANALNAGNPHIQSEAVGSGMEIRTLHIDIQNIYISNIHTADGISIDIGKPEIIEQGPDQGKLSSLIDFEGSGGPDVYLTEGQQPSTDTGDAKWQRTLHISKQQATQLAQQWVKTVLNTAADNWNHQGKSRYAYQHSKIKSFPSLHAQGKDMVFQIQALYNEDPDHIDYALNAGHNPHIDSEITANDMENPAISIDAGNLSMSISVPVYYRGEPADGPIRGFVSQIRVFEKDGDVDTVAYLGTNQKIIFMDDDATLRRNLNTCQKDLSSTILSSVQTVLDTAAKNW